MTERAHPAGDIGEVARSQPVQRRSLGRDRRHEMHGPGERHLIGTQPVEPDAEGEAPLRGRVELFSLIGGADEGERDGSPTRSASH